MTSAVYLQAMGVVSALGEGAVAHRAALFAAAPGGVEPTDLHTPGRLLHLGCVRAGLIDARLLPLPSRSRTVALLAQALQQMRPAVDEAVARHGPGRVAVIIGTSTAGLEGGLMAARALAASEPWPAGYVYAQQEPASPAAWLAGALGATGPCYGISTACSSGAKALASGARLLGAGLADVVIAGGTDALSPFTIAGFSALESVSAARCNPMSLRRDGINLGEGAAVFLMGREDGPVRLAGWGETSDAHHMSAPDPTGRGAASAMRLALQRAGVAAIDIDYLNLHGTATRHNDAMESLAVAEVLGMDVPVGSTKPLTGHALAAAGAIEAAIAWQVLADNPGRRLPPHWWDGERDPALPALRLVVPGDTAARAPRHVLSNSFAFGGSNVSLLFAAP